MIFKKLERSPICFHCRRIRKRCKTQKKHKRSRQRRPPRTKTSITPQRRLSSLTSLNVFDAPDVHAHLDIHHNVTLPVKTHFLELKLFYFSDNNFVSLIRRLRLFLAGCYSCQGICSTFGNFWSFYNQQDGALGLFTSECMFIVVVSERIKSSLSPWSCT